MKGKLIVFEGLDCSGKTTAINELIKNNPEKFVYSKGIGSDTFIGRTSRKFPSTFLFLIELTYTLFTRVKPNLNKGKIVLQDRYDISIASYVPLAERWYNKFFLNLFKPFIMEPDAIVYFHLPLKERIKRLKEKGTKYELTLANNPDTIHLREKEYLKWYDGFKGRKLKIDTKKNNLSQTTKILGRFLLEGHSS